MFMIQRAILLLMLMVSLFLAVFVLVALATSVLGSPAAHASVGGDATARAVDIDLAARVPSRGSRWSADRPWRRRRTGPTTTPPSASTPS